MDINTKLYLAMRELADLLDNAEAREYLDSISWVEGALNESAEPLDMDLDTFLKNAEVILVDDARTFDINRWEAETAAEIADELDEEVEAVKTTPKFIKYRLDAADIDRIIERLRTSSINITDYWKTSQFLKKNNLQKEDLVEVVRSLSAEDYKTNSRPVNSEDYNEASIFVKNSKVRDLGPFDLYIKLDYDTIEESPVVIISFHSKSNRLREELEEYYWRVIYRHPTGIYATTIVRGPDHYHAENVLRATYHPQSWSFEPISKERFEALLEQGVPELDYKGKIVAIQGDDYSIIPEEKVPDQIRRDLQGLEESLERNTVEEDLNVNVDTNQQNINVAEEDSGVDIRIDSKNYDDAECDAEAELQELARDPKYTKAFAYLMKTLQLTEDSVEEVSEQDSVSPEEDMLQEDLENLLGRNAEDSFEESELETEPPKGEEGTYMASMLGNLVKEEYDAIASYAGFLQDLEANNFGDESDRKVICDILAEENVHVGQLQELLKKVYPAAENVEVGTEEAQEQIEEVEEKKDED